MLDLTRRNLDDECAILLLNFRSEQRTQESEIFTITGFDTGYN